MLVSSKSFLGGRKKIWAFCFPRHLSGTNLTGLQFSLQREFAPQSLALVQKMVASDLAAACLPCRVWDNVGRCWTLQIQGCFPKQGVLLQGFTTATVSFGWRHHEVSHEPKVSSWQRPEIKDHLPQWFCCPLWIWLLVLTQLKPLS